MKADYINPFLNAAINVLSTMAFVKPKAGKPFIKKNNRASGDISGVIGMTGHARAVVIFSFSEAAALKIVSSMLGETYTELNTDITDAIGELTNMLSGDARRALAEKGYIFEAGLPSIIKGPNHEIENQTNGPTVAIPFDIDGAIFTVEASFDK